MWGSYPKKKLLAYAVGFMHVCPTSAKLLQGLMQAKPGCQVQQMFGGQSIRQFATNCYLGQVDQQIEAMKENPA
jgi:hypothetical protein